MTPPPNEAARDLHSRAVANESLPPLKSTPEAQIRHFLELLFEPGDIFEVRAPKCADRPGSTFKGTTLGYYQHDQIQKAARDIATLDAQARAPGIYVGLNPVASELLARAANRLKDRAEEATADADVVRRRRMLVDADPVRAKGISSTEQELAFAQAKAQEVRAALTAMGWPEPLAGVSGNGGHLIYAIDLPADDGGLIERVLKALAARFNDEHVKVDTSVGNASRITKIMGTVARKGEHLVGLADVEPRPHRRAHLLDVPRPLLAVNKAQLESLAGEVPQPSPPPTRSTASHTSRDGQVRFERFDHCGEGVRGYLERRGVTVKGQKHDTGCTYLYLDRCPVDQSCAAENGTDIAVLVFDDGKIAYKNLHSRGTGLTWPDVREALEPGYRAMVAGRTPPVVRAPAPARAATVRAYKSFPVDAVPAPIRGYITAWSRALNCDPAFIALPALATLAACVGTTRRLMLKRSWKEPCILWCVIVAPSGTLKSPALDAALNPLRLRQGQDLSVYQQEMEVHERDLLDYERDRDLWKKGKLDGDAPNKPAAPVCIRRMVSDLTIEALAPILLANPRGVLLGRDELAGWVRSFDAYRGGRGGDAARWLETHRGGELLVDRKTGVDRIMVVPRAAVSVTGCIQPRVLANVLDGENMANGFAARLLCAAPPRQVKVWTEADIDDAIAQKYDATLGGLLDLKFNCDGEEPCAPVDLVLNPDARAHWIKFYNDFGIEQASLVDEDLSAAFSKLEGYCARLALLFHLIRSVSNDRSVCDHHRVDQASLEAARVVTRWFCDEAERVYTVLSQDDRQTEQFLLLDVIRRHAGAITVRLLQQSSRRWRDSAEGARTALDGLVKSGLARWEYPRPAASGGQPTEVCRLLGGGNGNTTPGPSPAGGGSATVTGDELPGEERGQWMA